MIAPKPFIAICKKCGRTRLIVPKSVSDFFISCDKCGASMSKKGTDELIGTLADIGKSLVERLFGNKKS